MVSKKKIIDTAEELGWSVDFDTEEYPRGKREKMATFSQVSPAGEDFSFYVFYENLPGIAREVYSYWQDFDVDEHVRMWLDAKANGVVGVPDAVTLVDDAREIETMLENLLMDLSNL